ncbi:hypothetical protein L228DRAFT_243802 [Xylona heveae TC161]|uniref:Uncharacterized protein n=1 Tax=Xylona heveae (strain CBS 132557 / TC161) TaxID=1328760 RepID=A0A165IKG7_XYLHT|nr:hypothetical protein L228DRAFT_243802 [Xylona heveae TC161]KZF25024.1 hypothetical protein L228DRAFT_243802 [Xylona heveae TC161]
MRGPTTPYRCVIRASSPQWPRRISSSSRSCSALTTHVSKRCMARYDSRFVQSRCTSAASSTTTATINATTAAESTTAATSATPGQINTSQQKRTTQANENYQTQDQKLPLPPILDPVAQEATRKYRAPKPRPENNKHDRTPFQQKLAQNPYAIALSTPIRMCSVTATRLPRFFLINYGLIAHPTTGTPWYLPENIETVGSRGSSQQQAGAVKPANGETESEGVKDGKDENVQEKRGLGTYVLARQDLLRVLTHAKGRRWQQIIPHRQREMLRSSMKDIVWRNDMDEFVTVLLRQVVMRRLENLAQSQEAGNNVTPLSPLLSLDCDESSINIGLSDGACLLWLGPLSSNQETTVANDGAPQDMQESVEEKGEPQRATITIDPPVSFFSILSIGTNKKLPVYNLVALLGEDNVQHLRQVRPPVYSSEYALIKDGSRNGAVNSQALLWRLYGYMAQREDTEE